MVCSLCKIGGNNLTRKMKNSTKRWRETARGSALNRRLKTIRDIALGEEEYVPSGLPLTSGQEKGIVKMKELRERARDTILDKRLKTIRDIALGEEEYVPIGLPPTSGQEKGIAKMKALRERARETILDERLRKAREKGLNLKNNIKLFLTDKEEKELNKRLRTIRNSVFGGKKTKKKWTNKYKRQINCKKPKGFSQKQYCKKRKNRKTKKYRSQKGGMALHAAHKTWVCRGNIGCARNVNIFKT